MQPKNDTVCRTVRVQPKPNNRDIAIVQPDRHTIRNTIRLGPNSHKIREVITVQPVILRFATRSEYSQSKFAMQLGSSQTFTQFATWLSNGTVVISFTFPLLSGLVERTRLSLGGRLFRSWAILDVVAKKLIRSFWASNFWALIYGRSVQNGMWVAVSNIALCSSNNITTAKRRVIRNDLQNNSCVVTLPKGAGLRYLTPEVEAPVQHLFVCRGRNVRTSHIRFTLIKISLWCREP
jgi:hypothetical protein